jgi:hypothetical protein
VDRLRQEFLILLEKPTEPPPLSLGEELDVRHFFNQIEEQVVLLRRPGKDQG